MRNLLLPLVPAALLLIVAPAAATDVKVDLLSVTEVRHADLVNQDEEDAGMSFSQYEPGLKLKLELVGAAAGTATHYGKIELKTAEDDRGDALKLQASRFMRDPSKGFVQIDRSHMFFGREEESKGKLEVELNLELPQRSARELALIKGTVTLRTVSQADVLIDKVRSKEGQEIDHQLFKAAGITLKVVRPSGTQAAHAARSLTVEVQGKVDAVLELELLDAAGKDLGGGSFSFGTDTSRTFQLRSDAAMPADAKLKVSVATGWKDVGVPFQFKDIELP